MRGIIGTVSVDVLVNETDADAGPRRVISVTQPAHGTVAITGGGTGVSYAPDADYCNSPGGSADTFNYTINGGSSATASITVTCADDAPHAVDDAATVREGAGATSIPVLANDTDPDGGALAIIAVTDPANGKVTMAGGGSGLSYTPDPGYCNTPSGAADTFTYTLNGNSTATVRMKVTCKAPDTTAPNTTFTKTPKKKIKTRQKRVEVSFGFSSSEAGSTFECRLDDAEFAACESPDTIEVRKGKHTFSVRAVDAAGNADATPASFTFTVKKKKGFTPF